MSIETIKNRYEEKVKAEWHKHIENCDYTLWEKRLHDPSCVRTNMRVDEYFLNADTSTPRLVHFSSIDAIVFVHDSVALNLENEPAITYRNEWIWVSGPKQKHTRPDHLPNIVSKQQWVGWTFMENKIHNSYRINYMKSSGDFDITAAKSNINEYIQYAEDCGIDLFNLTPEDLSILQIKFPFGS